MRYDPTAPVIIMQRCSMCCSAAISIATRLRKLSRHLMSTICRESIHE